MSAHTPSTSSMVPGAPRPWKSTPLITGTAALHLGAAALIGIQPSAWPWAAGGVVASHLVLTATGLWPRSTWLGPNWTRLPRHATRDIALTIDDGPNPDTTPYLLDLLDHHAARATFFCIGERALAHPKLVEVIIARGHTVENHSQRHRHDFSFSGPRALRREIDAAQRALTEITGTRPLFFRAPAGLRNPFLEPILCEFGLQLASWTRRGFDTRSRNARAIERRLLHGLAPRDILLIHDGNSARDAHGKPVVFDVLPTVLRAAADAQLRWTTLRAAMSPAQPAAHDVI